MALYLSNNNNDLVGQVFGLDGNPVASRLEIDREFQENTAYTFNLTQYVLSIIEQDKIEDNTLMLVLPTDQYFRTTSRLVLGDGKGRDPEITLRVVVTAFQ
ncbi:MAG: hypothetical protein HC880_22385 [Bacteroidia bacterium]|nr:hypothetical protein [Bacteroidia bacterium]